MLVDCPPQQIWLTAQRHEHFVQMPSATRLAPRRFGAPGKCGTELVPPATDRFVRDHDTSFEQQFLYVAQAQAEPEILPNCAADDHGWKAVPMAGCHDVRAASGIVQARHAFSSAQNLCRKAARTRN
jgi:hypothetical protein